MLKRSVLNLLLDEHLSPRVAVQVRAKHPGAHIIAFQEWDGGSHLGEPDEVLLAAAAAQGLTLVTYDLRTIAPLLKTWGEQGTAHSGVVFIDARTLAPNDLGGLTRALGELWEQEGEEKWSNRVLFLFAAGGR